MPLCLSSSSHALVARLLPCSFIRQVLDRSGGAAVQIISKIENEAGLEQYDDILSVTDGIMVARGDLAMEVRAASGRQRMRVGLHAGQRACARALAAASSLL